MTSSNVGKILGWGQFLFQVLGSAFGAGIPTTIVGWLGLAGSLATAVGIHAASATDGQK